MISLETLPAGLVITDIGGACPAQASGTMHGFPFYFRARHGDWSLQVVRPGDDPVWPKKQMVHHADGHDPSHGWMSVDEVMAILLAEFAKVPEILARDEDEEEATTGLDEMEAPAPALSAEERQGILAAMEKRAVDYVAEEATRRGAHHQYARYRHAQIAVIAYGLYEKRGRVDGFAEADWFEAERMYDAWEL